MFRLLLLSVILCGLSASTLPGQTREERVRNDKKKVEAKGYWIYNDLPRAFDEAKKTGKPIVVVLRCLPCVECVKLDDELIDADQNVKPLLEQFVRVRVVSTNGLDLSLFQYDTDQSFAVFLLNADGTIYGRFGTRSSRTEWIGDVSVEGLAKALKGALVLHQGYPGNKSQLAGKRGPAPEIARPELYPSLKEKYTSKINYEGDVVRSCIHCHMIGDAQRELMLKRDNKLSDMILFPYPHPKTVGLVLDPAEMATVLSVTPNGDAEKAGFKTGDAIQTMAGQPLLSMADVQWILQSTPPEGGAIDAEVLRDGKPVKLSLKLPSGWRRRDDIAWRSSTWQLRRVALGGLFLGQVPEEDMQKLKLSPGSTALVVKHAGEYPPHNIALKAGVRKGDIVIGFNKRTDLLRETDLIANGLNEVKPGEKIELTILRDGKKQTINIHRSE
jgi:hypothetical protein